ncbi:MAG: histidine kinase dimerization/phosphoacceptor domain -containing protein [Methanosarcina sp.]
MEIGEKLPPYIGDLVKGVICRNSPEKMEVKAGNRVYLIVFHPLPEQECVNISGFDISDQKELEGNLRESERKYHLLFENMLDGFAYCKMLYDDCGHPVDFIYLDTNNAFERLTGLKEVNGQRATEAIPGIKESHPELFDIYGRVVLTGQPEKFEIVFKPLGIWLWVSVYSTEREHFVAVFENITEHKKTEEALSEAFEKLQIQSEELQVSNEELRVQSDELNEANALLHENVTGFRTLAENSPDLIARFDRQNNCIYSNPAAKFHDIPVIEEFYVWSVNELIDKANPKLRVNPIFAKSSEKQRENVFITGKPEMMEFQYTSSQGKKYYFDTKVMSEFVNNEVVSVLVISRDITVMKEAEAKLKETLGDLEDKVKERTADLEEAYKLSQENERRFNEAQKIAHIGSWDRNIVTGELYWSDETYRIYGRKPQEFGATYDAFLSYVHPDDRDYVANAVKEAINGEPYDIDYRIILTNGEERIVHAQGGAIFDEKNTPVRFRGTVQDITERKKAEEALANIDIARKKEIHHRIKNNLQVISSLLDLQAETFRDQECIEDSEVLKAFRESQDRVISMALIHEELYKGGRFETLSFSPYIEELAENLFQTYSIGNTNVSLNIDLVENAFFDMDTAVPLGIIINELVSNSLKHAFKGRDRGEIRIKLHREENGECKSEGCKSTNFLLSVSDNGIGIPEDLNIEDLESLGLQLVTSLVDQLDGELELKRNNGTEFTMKFIVTEKNNQ